MGNFCVKPRCCSCTSCCTSAISAKTMSVTIAGMSPISGAPCNCTLLNRTYVFGTPTVQYPQTTGGRRFCICFWNLPFPWACTTTGTTNTSNVSVCLMYNGLAATLAGYSCTGLDSFGASLPSGHTRIGIVLRGDRAITFPDFEFLTFWQAEYSSQLDCAAIANLSIPWLSDPTAALRKCNGTSATATVNLV